MCIFMYIYLYVYNYVDLYIYILQILRWALQRRTMRLEERRLSAALWLVDA